MEHTGLRSDTTYRFRFGPVSTDGFTFAPSRTYKFRTLINDQGEVIDRFPEE